MKFRREDHELNRQPVACRGFIQRREMCDYSLEIDLQLPVTTFAIEFDAIAKFFPDRGRQLVGPPRAALDRYHEVHAETVLVGAVRSQPPTAWPTRLPEDKTPFRMLGGDVAIRLNDGLAHRVVNGGSTDQATQS